MATERKEADEIRLQMAKIRNELHQEMREVVGGATAATDWRSYVRNRPWLAISLAFATGYMLVPRRIRPVSTVVVPVAGQPTPLDVKDQASNQLPYKAFRWALGIAWPVVIRAAQSFAANALESLLIGQQSGPGPASSSRADAARENVRSDVPGFSPRG